MKTIFKLFAIDEIDVITNVSLFGSISTVTETIIRREHISDHSTEEEALEEIDQWRPFPPFHGFEVLKTYKIDLVS